MLLSDEMITGFNTDVQHGGLVYHVQTEDRGRDHPFLDSLVYLGGTIVAKKSTSYGEQVKDGAGEAEIAQLLKRQHQVIIAAIRAGRIDELIKRSAEELRSAPGAAPMKAPGEAAIDGGRVGQEGGGGGRPRRESAERRAAQNRSGGQAKLPPPPAPANSAQTPPEPGAGAKLPPDAGVRQSPPEAPRVARADIKPASPSAAGLAGTRPAAGQGSAGSSPSGKIGLNLDQVITDYLKRSSEQGKLEVKVLSPTAFTAGKSVALRVQVGRGGAPESEAIVTVKVIGTAFKPLVYMAKADKEGLCSFNISLPSFSAGTAAIVIEAQSNRGRGELKHLIRRS